MTTGQHARDEGLWVISEAMPDGSYGVAVTVGADFTMSLDRDQATAYAAACVAQATAAEHATAVMRLLIEKLGFDDGQASVLFVGQLRERYTAEQPATGPLQFVPTIGRAKHPRPDAGAFVPLIEMRLHDQTIGQISPAELRHHATGALSALAAADLDDQLRLALVEHVGVTDDIARNTVHSLGELWPADRSAP